MDFLKALGLMLLAAVFYMAVVVPAFWLLMQGVLWVWTSLGLPE